MTEVEERNPNVLILLFDDMRFDGFSYRGGIVPTPNIDALAAESTRFDTAITTYGLCSPSRAALFTGRWGHRTGLDDNVFAWRSQTEELDPVTQGGIIRRASDAGYYVGYVGKWHLGASGPQRRGADFTSDFEAEIDDPVRNSGPYARRAGMAVYLAGGRDANGEKTQYYETEKGTYEDTLAAQKVRSAERFLKEAAEQDRPFFGVVSFKVPHPAYHVPEPYASMFDPAELELPANFHDPMVNKPINQYYAYWPWHDVSHMTELDWRKTRAHYFGTLAMIDRAVGEIIAAAKAEGVYDDLHIVLLGDQGSMMGEHNLFDKAPYAYDELIRIPLLMRDPTLQPRIVTRHVSMIDIPATLGEWMNLPPDGPIDGQSLIPLMEQGDAAIPANRDEAIYAYEVYNGIWAGLRAIRTPGWKYVWNAGDSLDELYDLNNDPGEITNRIDDPAAATKLLELRQRLSARLKSIEDPSVIRLDRVIVASQR